MSHRVVWTTLARRQLRRLPSAIRQAAEADCESLGERTRPRGVKKKRGYRNRWEIRIAYRYRADYEVDDDNQTVLILEVYPRKEGHGKRRA